MNLTLTPDDLQAAPDTVKRWLVGKLFIPPPEQGAWVEAAPKAIEADVEEEAEAEGKAEESALAEREADVGKADDAPTISREELMKRAIAVLKAKGESAIAEIVRKLGIRRISECPQEKLADLLAELAVHE